VLIEAANPITTRLMLACKTRPRRSWIPILLEVSGRMKALLCREFAFTGYRRLALAAFLVAGERSRVITSDPP